PAESLGMNFEAPPIVTGGDPIRVRVSVDFPRHSGVYAWALASKLTEMVSDGDVLHELLRRGDRSAEELLSGADDLDRSIARHPAGKARPLHPIRPDKQQDCCPSRTPTWTRSRGPTSPRTSPPISSRRSRSPTSSGRRTA